MPFKLFLDDERTVRQVTWIELPLGPWSIVRNYNDFVSFIEKNGLPEFISFDHDLGQEHYADVQENMKKMLSGEKAYIDYSKFQTKTGYDCAKWLITDYLMPRNLKMCSFSCHSMNPIGKANIEGLLNNYNKIMDDNGPQVDKPKYHRFETPGAE